ncbi:hypothetical protein GF345_05225 [Candidatus Woesearchaeota archaeon]|nr:hypothetical protein [Candidatus Woesearchaeota archaeon]
MPKKSQITVFIMIGVLMFVLIGSVAYITSYKYAEDDNVPPSMQQIKLFTEECLQETAEGAIMLSGVQGGVIYLGDVVPNADTFYSYSTYWYDAGDDTSVSEEFMEAEISRYIEEEINNRCIKDYKEFHEIIETGDIEAEADIKEGYVELSMEYPVTMFQGDTRTMISSFSAMIPVRMGRAIEIANEIVEKEIEDPDYVPLSEIAGMDMPVVPYRYSDDIMIYSVIDEQNEVKGMAFKLVFANRFGDEKSKGNSLPRLLNADNLLLVKGVEAEYQFQAFDPDDDALDFDSIGRFPVDDTGLLKFTPTDNDVGEHALTVIVEDEDGGRDSRTINILVLEA